MAGEALDGAVFDVSACLFEGADAAVADEAEPREVVEQLKNERCVVGRERSKLEASGGERWAQADGDRTKETAGKTGLVSGWEEILENGMKNGNEDPCVEAKIKEAPEFAQPILRHLRALVHRACPDVQETLKWGMPSFTHNVHAQWDFVWNSGVQGTLHVRVLASGNGGGAGAARRQSPHGDGEFWAHHESEGFAGRRGDARLHPAGGEVERIGRAGPAATEGETEIGGRGAGGLGGWAEEKRGGSGGVCEVQSKSPP